jgi:hypothetical protein
MGMITGIAVIVRVDLAPYWDKGVEADNFGNFVMRKVKC